MFYCDNRYETDMVLGIPKWHENKFVKWYDQMYQNFWFSNI
jgi:hypothetical protein